MTDIIRPWQVRRVWFAYAEDPSRGKSRRVIVKEVDDDGCAVIYVTSKVDKYAGRSDFYPLRNWRDEGFDRASIVGWRRVIRVPIDQLGECMGELSPYDRLELQMRFQLH